MTNQCRYEMLVSMAYTSNGEEIIERDGARWVYRGMDSDEPYIPLCRRHDVPMDYVIYEHWGHGWECPQECGEFAYVWQSWQGPTILWCDPPVED